MKTEKYPWNIGDEFVAPKWDELTVYRVDKVGPDYIQSTQPGGRVKLRFKKSTIIPITTNSKTYESSTR